MATQTDYKTGELGMIPQDWDVVELGKVCDIDTENLTSNTDSDYEFDYISLEQIDNGHLLNTEKYKFKDAPSRARRVVRKNDVLISTVRPNLMSHYYVKNEVRDLICSTGFSVVRGTNKLNMPYLYHHLFANIINSQINLVVVGSNYPAINSHDIKNLKIPLPSTPEQTAIATALSDTDALISSLQTLIVKKKAIKLSAMQNLLSGKIRLPEFAQRPDGSPKTTHQTELGLLPEDWEVVELGEVAEIQRGASPRPIDSPIWFSQSSNIGWLRISDVTKSEKYLYNTTQNLSEEGIKNSRYIAKDNLIMSICATVGKPIINKKDICVHDGFVVFGNPKFDIEFMFYVLQEYESKWINQGQTGSQMNLNTDLIKNKIVCLPPLPEQTAIAQLLSDMDAEIEALEGRLKKTQSLKQGMMQALLSGKIRLPLK